MLGELCVPVSNTGPRPTCRPHCSDHDTCAFKLIYKRNNNIKIKKTKNKHTRTHAQKLPESSVRSCQQVSGVSTTLDIPDSVMKTQDPQFKVSTLMGLLILVHSYSCRALWQAVEGSLARWRLQRQRRRRFLSSRSSLSKISFSLKETRDGLSSGGASFNPTSQVAEADRSLSPGPA